MVLEMRVNTPERANVVQTLLKNNVADIETAIMTLSTAMTGITPAITDVTIVLSSIAIISKTGTAASVVAGSGLGVGVIIGIVIGSIAGVAVITALLCYVIVIRQRDVAETTADARTTEPVAGAPGGIQGPQFSIHPEGMPVNAGVSSFYTPTYQGHPNEQGMLRQYAPQVFNRNAHATSDMVYARVRQ